MSEKKHDFQFSYSSLSKLITNPKLFHKEYILGEKELRDETYFKAGELFHCFVLEPENFNEKFAMLPSKLPSDNIREIINRIYNDHVIPDIEKGVKVKGSITLSDYCQHILNILEEMNLHQSLTDTVTKGVTTTGDSKRLDKVVNDVTLEYFNACIEGYGKTIVDSALVQTAGTKAGLMMEHPDIKALFEGELPEVDIRKELELQIKPNESDTPFGFKGIIDMVRIDYERCIIHIVDYKTTSKTLDDWRKDFESSNYMYWLQVMIYRKLIMSLVPKESKKQWVLKISFPVIDKFNNVYVFNVSQKSLLKWNDMAKGVYEIADWHLTNMRFDLPYEYENKLVVL